MLFYINRLIKTKKKGTILKKNYYSQLPTLL